MSQISDILSDEHKNIIIVIEALNNESNELESRKEIDKEFFQKIIDFIRNYADRFHHAKEEDTLFKELCKPEASKNMHCNPVEQMLHEHDLGRNFVKEIEQGVEQDNKTKVIENARAYTQLLQEHIFKEDNILYPMAEQVLNEKTKQKLIKKFIEIEKEREAEKNKHLAFVDKLKQVQANKQAPPSKGFRLQIDNK